MLIKQIIEFELSASGPPGRICTSTTSYFHDMTKQKSLRNIVEWIILLFTAKKLQEALYLTAPYLGQITYKIYAKMQDFKRALELNCE